MILTIENVEGIYREGWDAGTSFNGDFSDAANAKVVADAAWEESYARTMYAEAGTISPIPPEPPPLLCALDEQQCEYPRCGRGCPHLRPWPQEPPAGSAQAVAQAAKTIRRRGRLNPGTWYEVTDGEGDACAEPEQDPCPVCGCEVRTPAGYLQCECRVAPFPPEPPAGSAEAVEQDMAAYFTDYSTARDLRNALEAAKLAIVARQEELEREGGAAGTLADLIEKRTEQRDEALAEVERLKRACATKDRMRETAMETVAALKERLRAFHEQLLSLGFSDPAPVQVGELAAQRDGLAEVASLKEELERFRAHCAQQQLALLTFVGWSEEGLPSEPERREWCMQAKDLLAHPDGHLAVAWLRAEIAEAVGTQAGERQWEKGETWFSGLVVRDLQDKVASLKKEIERQSIADAASKPAHPKCSICDKPAACLGQYDTAPDPAYACDECCGHGNEDGWCVNLEALPEMFGKQDEILREAEEQRDALADALEAEVKRQAWRPIEEWGSVPVGRLCEMGEEQRGSAWTRAIAARPDTPKSNWTHFRECLGGTPRDLLEALRKAGRS